MYRNTPKYAIWLSFECITKTYPDVFKHVVEPYGNRAANMYKSTSSSPELGVYEFDTEGNGQLDHISPSWLWTDDGSEDYMTSFS